MHPCSYYCESSPFSSFIYTGSILNVLITKDLAGRPYQGQLVFQQFFVCTNDLSIGKNTEGQTFYFNVLFSDSILEDKFSNDSFGLIEVFQNLIDNVFSIKRFKIK